MNYVIKPGKLHIEVMKEQLNTTRIKKAMFIKYSVIVFIFIFIQNSREEDLDDLVIELVKPNGKIRGHGLKSAKGREYYAFQQIPYGKPPVGENRFRPPEWHDDWDGILNCTENTKICHQFNWNLFSNGAQKSVLKLKETEECEDCLYVNVYTPVKPGSNNSLSVFFFIHGGSFVLGDGTFSSYGPKYLIDGDIVIVTSNYRLGPIGFLSTGDSEISGNMGLKDQHLALQWTYENIHLFGGNPKDIIVGGESAGSTSAGCHLLSQRTKGLTSGFIQQSGSNMADIAISLEPRKYALELGRVLDPTISENTSSLVYALKKASPDEIVRASALIVNPVSSGFMRGVTWAPVIEDVYSSQAFLTSPFYEEMMKGNFNRVPSFIGFNSEESLSFLPSNESVLHEVAAQYDVDPSLLITPSINVDNRTMVGEKLKETYTASSFEKDLEAFVKFTSDSTFIRPSIRQAELASEHVPVYLYQLSAAININNKYPGVSHVLDMLYLWEMESFPRDKNPVDEEVREIVLRLWWNFIKYKNPTPERDPVLQNIEWPAVEQENIKYLNLNKTLSIETNPRNYNNMKNVLVEYMRPPFYVF